MNYIYAFLYFFFGFILQSTILKYFSVLGVVPNVIFVFVILFSFLFAEKYGIVYGAIFGLIQDICFGQVVGINALVNFTIAFFLSEIKRYVYRDNIWAVIFLTAILNAYDHFAVWAFIRLYGSNYDFLHMLYKMPVEMIYNIVLITLLYKAFIKWIIRYRGDKYLW